MISLIKIVVATLMVTSTLTAHAFDTQEEITKSAKQLDILFSQAAEVKGDYRMRVMLDVAGGVRMNLMKIYNPKGGKVTPEKQNQYQQTYSFALVQLAGLAETLGQHEAAACHTAESEWMQKAATIDYDDMSGMPMCRRDIYTKSETAKVQSLMMSDPKADKKYNILAGSLIKQINLNSYYIAKGLHEANDAAGK